MRSTSGSPPPSWYDPPEPEEVDPDDCEHGHVAWDTEVPALSYQRETPEEVQWWQEGDCEACGMRVRRRWYAATDGPIEPA